MNEANVFTVLDLKSAYCHIPINECDKHKTAFVVPKNKVSMESTAVWLNVYRVLAFIIMFCSFARSFYDDCVIFSKRADHMSSCQNDSR